MQFLLNLILTNWHLQTLFPERGFLYLIKIKEYIEPDFEIVRFCLKDALDEISRSSEFNGGPGEGDWGGGDNGESLPFDF